MRDKLAEETPGAVTVTHTLKVTLLQYLVAELATRLRKVSGGQGGTTTGASERLAVHGAGIPLHPVELRSEAHGTHAGRQISLGVQGGDGHVHPLALAPHAGFHGGDADLQAMVRVSGPTADVSAAEACPPTAVTAHQEIQEAVGW